MRECYIDGGVTIKGGFMKWRKSGLCPLVEVSSAGQVRSIKTGKIYSPVIKPHGYEIVRVHIDGKRKHYHLHRLVCEAFNGPPNGLLALHKDGNQRNNSASNLYWGTQAQNIEDRERHGKTMRGDSHYARKLSSADIPKIRKLLSDKVPMKKIALQFGTTYSAIYDIKRRKSWKTV